MADDKKLQADIQRNWNRTLDFNPEILTSVPAANTDLKGVQNAQIFLSANTNYHQVYWIEGVPFRVALTSAF
jgi:hypothetical protein